MTARATDSRHTYLVDTGDWPLVHIRMATDPDMAQFEALLRELEAVLAREEPLVALFDLRGLRSSAARRKRMVEWGRQHLPSIRRLMRAQAFVVGNRLEQGVVTAVQWLIAFPAPTETFFDLKLAEHWLRDQLTAAESSTGR